jgi:type II secretory pathway component GspD/PulD (secretin)
MQTAKGTEDRMVVIDVVMISTEETISTTKGVNLLNGLTLQFGGSVSGSSLPGLSYSSISGTGTVASATEITRAITLPSVNYTLNILNANNQRSEVLSRPSLIGMAGKQSTFFSGLELDAAAVASGSVGSGGLSIGGQAININKEIGVRLGVVPIVLEDGRLKMTVTVERTFLETPSSDVNFTFKLETSKDQINANVIMRYGETLILGGLSEKEVQYNRDGVPGLQDTPLLQYLFSNETRSDYQKSLLILMTPRLPQYIYQPDKARADYEKTLSEEEKPIANLQARYSDWFKPYPNWASVFHHLQDNGLYREFRTGDVELESWSAMQTLGDRLNQALDFLHY